MPIGKPPPKVRIKLRVLQGPPPKGKPPSAKKVVIKVPRLRPVKIVIPPKPRPGSKQLTCIRYDENGQWFIDEFVERSSLHDVLKEDRRHMTHVSCPKFQFQVSLAACPHYCSFPCNVHMATIQTQGWYKEGKGQPAGGERRKRRGGGSDDDV